MERLTERTGEGQAIPRMDLKNNGHRKCMERLAEYEDAGLTPEEVMAGKIFTGWWSEAALDDLRKMSCGDCKWKGERHQKCSYCIRNNNMKDNYEY